MKKQRVAIESYIDSETYEEMLNKTTLDEDLNLSHIGKVFEELKTSKFEVLKTQPFLDKVKIFIRGAVTRIGAYSNIGKSKLAYWITLELLRNGYCGAIFSTEVNRHTVLANLVCSIDSQPFWNIVDKYVEPSKNALDALSNLQIYDGRHGVMFLENIRDYIIANQGALDFIVIDFCQNIKDLQCSRDEYAQLSNYALEVQQIAQAFNICVIDLSQLANTAIKEDFVESGFIAFKGSGALYASADIGIQLKRDKATSPDIMEIQVRKHKFFSTGNISMKVKFDTGDFQYMLPSQCVNPKLHYNFSL